MKNKRHLAPALGALLLVSGVASVALLGGTSASAAGTPSSAYAISLTIADNEVIAPMPDVVSTDGSLVTESIIGLPDNPIVSGGVLNATAENGAASASTTDLAVGDGLLAELPAELTTALDDVCTQLSDALEPVTEPIDNDLIATLETELDAALQEIADATADSGLDLGALGALDITDLTDVQLEGLCAVLAGEAQAVGADAVIAECTGDTGTTTITDLIVLGLPVDIDTSQANQKIEIPGLLSLTVNRQTANADGTFTVDALALNLLGEIDLVVSSATCGEVTTDRETPDPSDAPSPTPVKSHVPVTG